MLKLIKLLLLSSLALVLDVDKYHNVKFFHENINTRSHLSEAEQLAVTNLNMFRRKQQELEEAEERAKQKETDMAKIKMRHNS